MGASKHLSTQTSFRGILHVVKRTWGGGGGGISSSSNQNVSGEKSKKLKI
jgi:hypothetical protein